MGISRQRLTVQVPRIPAQSISSVIDAIGDPRFEQTAIAFIDAVCGAEWCAFYRFESDNLTRLATMSLGMIGPARQQGSRYLTEQHWRRDPTIFEVRDRAVAGSPVTLVRVDPRNYSDPYLREIYRKSSVSERMIVGQAVPNRRYTNIMSIMRSRRRGPFCEDDVGRIGDLADLLIAMIAKHAEVTSRSATHMSLKSLVDIERCIANASLNLPTREVQVCARVLFGSTTPDIAAELQIGEESVATYRKRVYRRLNVSSRHELLTWYLDRWQQATAIAS